jgi:hypothetical protein
MDEQEPKSFQQELGRMPEGHVPSGAMPKPDVEEAANTNYTRFFVVFVIILLVAAVIFLVLPGLGR